MRDEFLHELAVILGVHRVTDDPLCRHDRQIRHLAAQLAFRLRDLLFDVPPALAPESRRSADAPAALYPRADARLPAWRASQRLLALLPRLLDHIRHALLGFGKLPPRRLGVFDAPV